VTLLLQGRLYLTLACRQSRASPHRYAAKARKAAMSSWKQRTDACAIVAAIEIA
jgi:hypothetical protein